MNHAMQVVTSTMAEYDADRDGVLSYAEFCSLLSSQDLMANFA